MDADSLLNPERRMLRVMQSRGQHKWTLDEILTACDWTDQAVAVGAGHGLTNAGFVKTNETNSETIRLAEKGRNAVENGLLEARIWKWISETDSPNMGSLQSQFERHEAGPGVGLLKRLGVQLDGGIFISENPSAISSEIQARSTFLAHLPASPDTLEKEMLEHFKSRRGLIESVITTTRTWSITKKGKAIDSEVLTEKQSISEITTELL